MTDYRKLDVGQLVVACGCLESACVSFILRCEREGIDTKELRAVLDEVHEAIDGLSE